MEEEYSGQVMSYIPTGQLRAAQGKSGPKRLLMIGNLRVVACSRAIFPSRGVSLFHGRQYLNNNHSRIRLGHRKSPFATFILRSGVSNDY